MAQPFDAAKTQLTGEPIIVARQVGVAGGWLARSSASNSGVLVYDSVGPPEQDLLWFDRGGQTVRGARANRRISQHGSTPQRAASGIGTRRPASQTLPFGSRTWAMESPLHVRNTFPLSCLGARRIAHRLFIPPETGLRIFTRSPRLAQAKISWYSRLLQTSCPPVGPPTGNGCSFPPTTPKRNGTFGFCP